MCLGAKRVIENVCHICTLLNQTPLRCDSLPIWLAARFKRVRKSECDISGKNGMLS